jgi:V8-like Glu-specific endopeptidase
MSRSLVFSLVVVCVACSAEVSSSSSNEADDPIVGGSADRGHRAVVAIRIGESLCTGSLVAPNVVLTARHCVSETQTSIVCDDRPGAQILGDRDPRSMLVYTGESANGTPVARGHALVVPSSLRLCGADAAALVLDRNVIGITPLRISSPPSSGAKVMAVGYGQQGPWGESGWKRKRSVRVLDVGRMEIAVSEGVCPGDSGGPLLDSKGAIVGIVSRGRVPCDRESTTNIYARADVHRDLVEKAVLE